MKKINALVVDDSLEFTSSVKKYFEGNTNIRVVEVLNDGSLVMDFLEKHPEVDILLMDIIMPGKDGIEILEEMAAKNIKKHVIILTSYRKEYVVQMTNKYNVDYYMLKPCHLDALEKRIYEIFHLGNSKYYKRDVNYEVQLKVTELLHDLGVPSQIRGYQYLREGILMLYQATELVGGITKEIYPEIASRYNTTPSRVERAIRHAIEVSWSRADYDMMDKVFGHSIDYDKAKPTNSEFMVTLSDVLKLENNKLYIYA